MQFDSNLSAHNVIRLGVDERKQRVANVFEVHFRCQQIDIKTSINSSHCNYG